MMCSETWRRRARYLITFCIALRCLTSGHCAVDCSKLRTRFLREHVNDLDTLLKAVAMGPFVTCTVFTSNYREFAVNWLYAITRYGRVTDALVAAFDAPSLADCLRLGFTCFNGTSLIPLPSGAVDFEISYDLLAWARPLLIRQILQRNYSVLSSDLDTIWLKDAYRSLAAAADRYDADVVGMSDEWKLYPNNGNLFLRSNVRTLRLMEVWLNVGFDEATGRHTGVEEGFHDQDGFVRLNGTAWQVCDHRTSKHHAPPPPSQSCLAVKAQGLAAVWLSPWHCCPHDIAAGNAFCGFKDGICSDELAYMHLVCVSGGFRPKRRLARKLGLWFVRSDTPWPHLANARWPELVNATHHRHSPLHTVNASSWELNRMTPHLTPDVDPTDPFRQTLPCPNDVAWLDLRTVD